MHVYFSPRFCTSEAVVPEIHWGSPSHAALVLLSCAAVPVSGAEVSGAFVSGPAESIGVAESCGFEGAVLSTAKAASRSVVVAASGIDPEPESSLDEGEPESGSTFPGVPESSVVTGGGIALSPRSGISGSFEPDAQLASAKQPRMHAPTALKQRSRSTDRR
jgi:hypothetical protein